MPGPLLMMPEPVFCEMVWLCRSRMEFWPTVKVRTFPPVESVAPPPVNWTRTLSATLRLPTTMTEPTPSIVYVPEVKATLLPGVKAEV